VTRLADRQIEVVLRNRVYFGVGAIARLPEVVAAAGGSRVFVVTDPGVRRSGVVDRVLSVLAAAGLETATFDEVEPNPAASTVERGAAALQAFGLEGTVVVPVGGGSSMDTAKALDLRAANEPLSVWELDYDGPSLVPGRPLVAVPTTAGTGAETNSFGVITDEAAGRKGYIGHPSLLPVATILDPELTVGLPPAATAATGIDAMTHSLESLLSANPNPFAESTAIGVIRTVAAWLPRAVADGTDLEARSQMLMASHLAGVGQASGTGVGLVHALGHALGTRGKLAHGTALAVILPEVLDFYRGVRDRELAMVGVALRVASPTEDDATAAGVAIAAIRRLCAQLGQRPTLSSLGFDGPLLDTVAQDAIDDAAIRNSPRLPSLTEARAILASVLD
jgi:alcohol dehydrogenase